MNLGTQVPDYGEVVPAGPAKPKKMKTSYPTITIEKDTGNAYKYGDEFTALVRFRVKEISHGEPGYGDNKPHHRCVLEALSMEPVKRPKKGLPA